MCQHEASQIPSAPPTTAISRRWADVPTDAVASTLARPLCRPVVRRHRALNPWSDTDAALLQTIARGEGTLTSSGPARLVLLGARDVTILSRLMKHNIEKQNEERALVEAGVMIKLGLDVHARQITVCRQIGNRTPQPAQVFTRERLLVWVRKMVELGAIVHSCYEAGVMGYALHRELTALGVKNVVVAPQKLSGPKRQKTDASDHPGKARPRRALRAVN